MFRDIAILVWLLGIGVVASAEQWVPMGAGKILVGAKLGHETPKDGPYRTEEMMRQALPTNSWFSSLAYMQWSGVLHAHPLSFKATATGLEMGLPEKAAEPIEAIKAWAWPPPPGRPIASVVHRHVAALKVRPKNFEPADARLSAKGDWSISFDMAEPNGERRLRAHIGHGIPYGFFEVSDGAAIIELEGGGAWDDGVVNVIDNKRVIYAGVRGVTYAVYLPADASVSALDSRRLEVNLPPNAGYFSAAALPHKLDRTDLRQARDRSDGIKTSSATGTIESRAHEAVTLNWENGPSDVNPDWAFGGAVALAAVFENANVLKFNHPVGSKAWAGVALIEAPGGIDLVADRKKLVNMRLWAEHDGTATIAMEDISSIAPDAGATRYLSVTKDVVGGRWNDIAFDFSEPDLASGGLDTNHNKMVLKVNEGNTLYVDEITLNGSDWIDHPVKSAKTTLSLPSQELAEVFARHAFAFVTGTTVRWNYVETDSRVITTYSFEVTPMDDVTKEPFVGLYPHHWMQLAPGTVLSEYELPSVRGPIRLAAVDTFQTELSFGGLLPGWPVTGTGSELKDLSQFLVGDTRRTMSLYTGHGNGTYWTGKALGSIAQLILVSEQVGQEDRAEMLEAMLKRRMEKWFRGEGGFYFGFHNNVGTLVGYPEEYFSASGMNDHHFHYGYWLMAAAHIARRDPQWLTPEQWGKMVDLIARDIATSERGRDDFPFIRNFDPYEGHSWARGNSDFYGHGNDQESSSEAINAWAALAFLGEFTGNRELRDLGVYLYVTEIASVLNYWFDIHGIVFDPDYPKPIASMVFGGGYGYSTWWTEEPRQIHGINLLPITSASVYLAQIPPERALSDIKFMKERRAEYETAAETDGTPSVIWDNVFVSWLALNDPQLALDNWSPDADGSMELGDTRSRTLAWALTMKHFGKPDLSIRANTMMYGVFRSDVGVVTYCSYNAQNAPRTVEFSDGFALTVPSGELLCEAN